LVLWGKLNSAAKVSLSRIDIVWCRALRGCGLVLKNRKTAHQNRGFGVIFTTRCGCGFGSAVVVLPQKPRLRT